LLTFDPPHEFLGPSATSGGHIAECVGQMRCATQG
jgi:hypothetical protein